MARNKTFDGKSKMVSILAKEPDVRLTMKEIARRIFEEFPNDCEIKRKNSKVLNTDEELIGQIAAEIGGYWRTVVDSNPKIHSIDVRPKEFYYTEDNSDKLVPSTQETSQKRLSEHQLYPLLGEFALNELRCYTMRIDEKKSSNSHGAGGNEWLHPDVVGMIALSEGWDVDVKSLSGAVAAERVHLVSFEVKKDITRGTVRKYFFQTVSNSSWANFAYLAASSDLDDKTSEELRLLCVSYGVGYIHIDEKGGTNSRVITPAKYKDILDFNALNRLASENPDALEFVRNVKGYVLTNDLRGRDWDMIPKDID